MAHVFASPVRRRSGVGAADATTSASSAESSAVPGKPGMITLSAASTVGPPSGAGGYSPPPSRVPPPSGYPMSAASFGAPRPQPVPFTPRSLDHTPSYQPAPTYPHQRPPAYYPAPQARAAAPPAAPATTRGDPRLAYYQQQPGYGPQGGAYMYKGWYGNYPGGGHPGGGHPGGGHPGGGHWYQRGQTYAGWHQPSQAQPPPPAVTVQPPGGPPGAPIQHAPNCGCYHCNLYRARGPAPFPRPYPPAPAPGACICPPVPPGCYAPPCRCGALTQRHAAMSPRGALSPGGPPTSLGSSAPALSPNDWPQPMLDGKVSLASFNAGAPSAAAAAPQENLAASLWLELMHGENREPVAVLKTHLEDDDDGEGSIFEDAPPTLQDDDAAATRVEGK